MKLLSYVVMHVCVCVCLLSTGREARVSTNPTQQVELTLPVPAQVDGPGRDVDVHQVINDPALNVVLNLVHQISTAHVEDLDVGVLPVITENGEKKKINGIPMQYLLYIHMYRTVLSWTCVPVSLIVYGHVAGFVTLDPLDEVLHGLLNIAICIIRTPKFNLLERNAQLSHKSQAIGGL